MGFFVVLFASAATFLVIALTGLYAATAFVCGIVLLISQGLLRRYRPEENSGLMLVCAVVLTISGLLAGLVLLMFGLGVLQSVLNGTEALIWL